MIRGFASPLSALAFVLLVLSLYGNYVESALCSPAAMISVDPPLITVSGETFAVSIAILDVVDLYGWEFRLRWNSTLLDVTNIDEGPFLKQGGETYFTSKVDNVENYILVDCTLLGVVPGVNGNGVLAVVEFDVRGIGESILDLHDTTLVSSLEQPIIHQSTDGYCYFENTLVGDVNGDGVVDIYDVVMVAVAFGSKPGDPNWNQAADLNDDAMVDIYDVVTVSSYFGETG